MATRHFGDITVELKGELAVLAIEGWVNYNNAGDLRAAIETVLDSGAVRLSIDLERCDGLASTAIGTLVQLAQSMEERGGGMRITRCSPSLDRLLRAMKLDQLLTVAPREG